MVYGAACSTGNTHQHERKDAEVHIPHFALTAESRKQGQKNDSQYRPPKGCYRPSSLLRVLIPSAHRSESLKQVYQKAYTQAPGIVQSGDLPYAGGTEHRIQGIVGLERELAIAHLEIGGK